MLRGLVPMVLGNYYHLCQEAAPQPERRPMQWLATTLFIGGGYGFLLAFYFAGAASIPRRFAQYPAELETGSVYAVSGMLSAVVLLVGFLLYLWETGRRWGRLVA